MNAKLEARTLNRPKEEGLGYTYTVAPAAARWRW